MGFGYRWKGGGKARWASEYNRSTGLLTERQSMLELAHKLYEEADIVVTYNGDKFDHKRLNSEWVSAGMTPPAPVQSLDLFKTVKRQFQFPSNKLDYVADRLLGEGKHSHAGHSMWRHCLDTDVDPAVKRRAWNAMGRYCRQDVDLLEPLHTKLLPWLPASVNVTVMGGPQVEPMCGKCGGDDLRSRGYAYTTTRAYKRYRCNDCGAWARGRSHEWGVVK